jgi:RNA polymerase sigma-70 factor (ECF subfamily)
MPDGREWSSRTNSSRTAYKAAVVEREGDPGSPEVAPRKSRRTNTMPERTDEELMLASGHGDRKAFSLLAERHYRGVMYFVQRFLGNIGRETAEDLTQDVFLKAWKAAARFKPRAAVRTWLLRSATNACLDYRRRSRLRRTLSLSDDAGYHPAGDAARSETASENCELADGTRRALAGLPTKQRAAVVLRHYHDLPYTEIAEILGLSVSAVESVLFRARRTLRAKLAVEMGGSFPQVSPGLGAEYG